MASLWTKFTDIFSRNKSGVVPQAPSGTGTSKYLREDGTWAVPSGGSSTLADLEDVNLNNPSDGQMLGYNATSQKWENKTPSASGHNYSTTEQVVGTWFDGSPIYEKTIRYNSNFNIGINNWKHSNVVLSDVKNFVNGFAIDLDGQFFPLAVGIFLETREIAVSLATTVGMATRDIRVIVIQYTKTTD